MFNEDIKSLSDEVKNGQIPENNLEEVIRRNVAYIALAATLDDDYRKEVEEYIASIEG